MGQSRLGESNSRPIHYEISDAERCAITFPEHSHGERHPQVSRYDQRDRDTSIVRD
jgi:hypothetical protein